MTPSAEPAQKASKVDLRTCREALGLSIGDAAARLLLSPRQVAGLESGDSGPFYNAAFRDKALLAYQKLLGLNAGVSVATSEAAAEPSVAGESSNKPGPEKKTAIAAKKTSRLPLMAIVVIGIVVLPVWMLGQTTSGDEARELATQPSPAMVDLQTSTSETDPALDDPPTEGPVTAEAPTPPAQSDPAVAAALEPPQNDAAPTAVIESTVAINRVGLVIQARGLCWVFARDDRGVETERTLRTGDQLLLERPLTYLALGNVRAVDVWFAGRILPLDAFANERLVVRLQSRQLKELFAAD